MSRFLAWRCDETGELFHNQSDYRSHLRKLARTRLVRRKLEHERKTFNDFIAPLKSQSTLDGIEAWILDNSERLMRHACVARFRRWNMRGQNKDPDNIVGDFGLTSFELRDLRWSERTSNTHNAPPGKETNFCSEIDLPRGYPGWRGRMAFSLKETVEFDTDFFKSIGIHTGSGGGGDIMRSYEVFMFAEEWVNLFTMEKLQGRLKDGAILKQTDRR